MRAAAAALLLVACAAEGDRADGGCPAGEMCSDVTPDGLFFLGSPLGDQPLGRMEPLAVAVGGTQRIRVVTGEGSTSPPFDTSFLAASSGAALAIGSVAPPDVEVQGLEAGEAFLRIVEPGTNLLFDRIAVAVKPVARVEVLPKSAALDEDFMDGGVGWALYAGGNESLVVRLFASDGARLADESLSLAVSGGLAAGAREAWDTLRVGGAGSAVGTLVVRTGDGTRRDATVAVATGIDDVISVAAIGGADSTNDPQSSARPAIFCFRAVTAGALVAGATWTFAGSTGLTATPLGSCASVRSELPAAGLLTVTASGTTRDFAVSFAAGKPAATARAAAAAGERALSAPTRGGSSPPAPR